MFSLVFPFESNFLCCKLNHYLTELEETSINAFPIGHIVVSVVYFPQAKNMFQPLSSCDNKLMLGRERQWNSCGKSSTRWKAAKIKIIFLKSFETLMSLVCECWRERPCFPFQMVYKCKEGKTSNMFISKKERRKNISITLQTFWYRRNQI